MTAYDDLARLMKGANITVTINHAPIGTQYTGPVQINNHSHHAEALKLQPVCGICGFKIHDANYNHSYGPAPTHWRCIHQRDERRERRVIEPTQAPLREIVAPDPEEQIEAPQMMREDLVNPEKYAAMQRPYFAPLVEVKRTK